MFFWYKLFKMLIVLVFDVLTEKVSKFQEIYYQKHYKVAKKENRKSKLKLKKLGWKKKRNFSNL
jgi:hypothetical protein